MSRVSFNRKRVKLKQLLGIRARLALLALILVGPLMLERVRSLEDIRGKQIAAASVEFSGIELLTKHSVCRARGGLAGMIEPSIESVSTRAIHDSGVVFHTVRRCGDTSWRDTT